MRMLYSRLSNIRGLPAGLVQARNYQSIFSENHIGRESTHTHKGLATISPERIRKENGFKTEGMPAFPRAHARILRIVEKPCVRFDRFRAASRKLPPIGSANPGILECIQEMLECVFIARHRILCKINQNVSAWRVLGRQLSGTTMIEVPGIDPHYGEPRTACINFSSVRRR